jgi:hypothetical protein
MTQAEIERLKAAKAKHPSAGRRSLAQLAGVSDGKAKRFLRGATKPSRGRATADTPAGDEETLEVTPAVSGFMLNNKNLLAKKPTDVWRGRFFALRRGMGYRIRDLSKEWGVTEDNVKQHAKSHGALRYMEDPDVAGQYISIAVHPETPKGK